MRAEFTAPRYLWGGVLLAGSAGALLALAGINTAARGPLVLLFLVAAPALAVAGLLRGIDRAASIVVAIAAAIVINVLVAETMLAVGAWSPRAGLVAIAIISAAIGAIGLRPAHRAVALPAWGGHPQRADGGISSRT
jgi:hypothetical protein